MSKALTGTVQVTLTIRGDGTVAASHAEGMGNSALETCVADAFRAARFPERKARPVAEVTVAIALEPNGG